MELGPRLAGGLIVPLSEHEQRILAEMEESLVREDPRFAERVKSETVYRHAGRHCIWSAATFVLGVVVLVAFYSRSILAGLAGVAIMFGSAVVFERNIRRVGRAGWQDLTRTLHNNRKEGEQPPASGGPFRHTRDWLRAHFRRDG